ncbi:Calmodulin [Pseudocercospora fuligena]|uniref:Calmodulin n=1 Tax=Pseudocercospora fuligena TaxID=685502 RepID=A0A8H6RN44_9PEZI|nr:Calmodulin [Pseudocercospora fuligena]
MAMFQGEISAAELGEVMRSLGLKPTDQELQDMLQEVDADNSGSIDLNEFMTMMSHRATAVDTEEELRQAFNVFDRDGSGTISVTELRDMLKALGDNLTDAEVDQIMKSADTDGDKTISFEEFKKIMEDST